MCSQLDICIEFDVSVKSIGFSAGDKAHNANDKNAHKMSTILLECNFNWLDVGIFAHYT